MKHVIVLILFLLPVASAHAQKEPTPPPIIHTTLNVKPGDVRNVILDSTTGRIDFQINGKSYSLEIYPPSYPGQPPVTVQSLTAGALAFLGELHHVTTVEFAVDESAQPPPYGKPPLILSYKFHYASLAQ